MMLFMTYVRDSPAGSAGRGNGGGVTEPTWRANAAESEGDARGMPLGVDVLSRRRVGEAGIRCRRLSTDSRCRERTAERQYPHMNLPNALTLGRIFLVPLLVVVLLTKFEVPLVFGVRKELLGAAIFGLARAAGVSNRSALFATALASVYPYLVYYTAPLGTEGPFAFFVAAGSFFLVSGLGSESPRFSRIALGGLLLGAGNMMRPNMTTVLPCLALWFAYRYRSRIVVAVKALVVLRPGRVREQLEHGRIDIDRVRQAQRLLHHPHERDVGEPRFGLRVAAADVGMTAREPHLSEARRRVRPVGEGLARRLLVPRHAGEARPVFIDGERVPGIAHRMVELGVVERLAVAAQAHRPLVARAGCGIDRRRQADPQQQELRPEADADHLG